MLLVTVLIAIFALQNSVEVEIRLWFWSLNTSVALVVIITFSIGALAGILFSIPGLNRRRKRRTAAGVPASESNPGSQTEPAAGENRSGPIDPQVEEFEDV